MSHPLDTANLCDGPKQPLDDLNNPSNASHSQFFGNET